MAEKEDLSLWLPALRGAADTPWDNVPDIGLYMDQVVGYLNRQLSFLSEDEPLLSPSMVNNYVKDGNLSRPQKKRYDRGQLAELYMLCSLKQVLPIDDAADLIRSLEDGETAEQVYARFLARQKETCNDCAALAEKEGDRTEKLHRALTLALEASVFRATALRLVHELQDDEKTAVQQRKKENRAAAKAVRAEARAQKAKTRKTSRTKSKTKTEL